MFDQYPEASSSSIRLGIDSGCDLGTTGYEIVSEIIEIYPLLVCLDQDGLIRYFETTVLEVDETQTSKEMAVVGELSNYGEHVVIEAPFFDYVMDESDFYQE